VALLLNRLYDPSAARLALNDDRDYEAASAG